MRLRHRELKSSGFTLLEVLMTIAIAMLLMAIAVSSFLSWLPTLRLSSAARQVATHLQVARMKAISQNTIYRAMVVSATTYTLEKNDGGFVTDSGPFSLPDGITFAAAPGTTSSEFQPRGTANTTVGTPLITLNNGGGTSRQVQIAPVGRVKICPC